MSDLSRKLRESICAGGCRDSALTIGCTTSAYPLTELREAEWISQVGGKIMQVIC
jgi:hypothetical protein